MSGLLAANLNMSIVPPSLDLVATLLQPPARRYSELSADEKREYHRRRKAAWLAVESNRSKCADHQRAYYVRNTPAVLARSKLYHGRVMAVYHQALQPATQLESPFLLPGPCGPRLTLMVACAPSMTRGSCT